MRTFTVAELVENYCSNNVELARECGAVVRRLQYMIIEEAASGNMWAYREIIECGWEHIIDTVDELRLIKEKLQAKEELELSEAISNSFYYSEEKQ